MIRAVLDRGMKEKRPSHALAVDASEISYAFGDGPTEVKVLHDFDLRVAEGEVVALMGPSGSGKTTFLTLAGCLRRVQSGSLRLLGEELSGASEEQLVSMRRRLGFIFQLHNLHESLTALQNVQMGVGFLGPGRDAALERAAKEALSLVGLEDRMEFMPAQLSGGQKQRVAVARALVGAPEVLFADEPTAALDRGTSHEVVGLFRRLAAERGTAVLMVTHDARVLEAADRVVEIQDGRIVTGAET